MSAINVQAPEPVNSQQIHSGCDDLDVRDDVSEDDNNKTEDV